MKNEGFTMLRQLAAICSHEQIVCLATNAARTRTSMLMLRARGIGSSLVRKTHGCSKKFAVEWFSALERCDGVLHCEPLPLASELRLLVVTPTLHLLSDSHGVHLAPSLALQDLIDSHTTVDLSLHPGLFKSLSLCGHGPALPRLQPASRDSPLPSVVPAAHQEHLCSTLIPEAEAVSSSSEAIRVKHPYLTLLATLLDALCGTCGTINNVSQLAIAMDTHLSKQC